MRHGGKKEQLVISDLSIHRTTSLDVMIAKAKIFGFLAAKSILAQTNVHIINLVTKGDGMDCLKFTVGILYPYAIRGSLLSYFCPHNACFFD